ncbi:hypothetical protein HCH54_006340 [Aspergillus fumigatus]
MDRPKASEEAAPAYHELFDTELMNQPTATSSRTHQYAAVPDNDPDGNSYTADHHDVESHPQNSSNQLSQLDPTSHISTARHATASLSADRKGTQSGSAVGWLRWCLLWPLSS